MQLSSLRGLLHLVERFTMYREWLANAVPSQRRHVCFVGAEQFVTIDAVECGAKFEQQK